MIPEYGLSFNVLGTPAQQGSKIARSRGSKHWVQDSNEAALKPWREAIVNRAAELFSGHRAYAGAVEVAIEFRFQRPAAHFGSGKNAHVLKPSAPHFRAISPDIDKLARAVLDALTEAGIYRDDKQVAVGRLRKRYVFPGETPGAAIAVTPLEAVDGVAEESAA